MRNPDFLQTLWFILIGVLWVGYFVLEGVGMLVRPLGRDDVERRILIHTIGPVWDGNEVWLLVAGGATFAAFPGWYASAFSGFYLALFLVLAGLIVRGVSFEFWGKSSSRAWRSTWEWALAISSGLVALLWGVAWANFVHGVAMNAAHNMTATLWDLLHPYALLGGLTTVALFLAHGSVFLTLRTKGDLEKRAHAVARWATPAAAGLLTAFLIWTLADQANQRSAKASAIVLAVLAISLAAIVPAILRRSPGRAFALSCGAIALWFVTLFVSLFPYALPSTTNPAYSLTLRAASSTSYTLTVMTVVAVIFVPIVLAYQAWTYWVFRHRLGREEFESTPTPIAVLSQRLGGPGGVADPPAPEPTAPV